MRRLRQIPSPIVYRTLGLASPLQCRAGRALLGITQDELAAAARTTCAIVSSYEREVGLPSLDTLHRITEMLRLAGIALVGTSGVRFSPIQAAAGDAKARQTRRPIMCLPSPPRLISKLLH